MKTQALLTGLCLTAFPWAAALQSTPCCEGEAAPAATAQLAPVLESTSTLVALAPPAQEARRGQIGVYLSAEGGKAAVDGLVEGGAAQQAGIQPGDTIVAVDGRPVGSADELVQRVKGRKAGDSVRLTLERDGWRRELEITLGAPQADGAGPELRDEEEIVEAPVLRDAQVRGRLERIEKKLSTGGGAGGGGLFRVESGDGPDVLRLHRAEAPRSGGAGGAAQGGDEAEGERCCEKCGDCCGGGAVELKGLGQGHSFGPGGAPQVFFQGGLEELHTGDGAHVFRWRSGDDEARRIEVEVQRDGGVGGQTRAIVVRPQGDGAPRVRVLEGEALKELKAGGGSWSTEDGGHHDLHWYRVEEHDAPQAPRAGGGMRLRAPSAPGAPSAPRAPRAPMAPRMGPGGGGMGGAMGPGSEELQDLRAQLEELRDELRELRQSLRRARAEGGR